MEYDRDGHLYYDDITGKFGYPISDNPALIKGGKIYKLAGNWVTHYEDHQAETHGFSLTHNVRPASEAIGAKGCDECHSKGSNFFYRKVLIDPYDEDGKPVYQPTWKLMGYSEEQVEKFTSMDMTTIKNSIITRSFPFINRTGAA